ncbi:sensor histidine kinase [Bifidobacterium simiarum]|uniref:histidine kinase n=1 Tax=Bifidobacterium simiarum TaxID=2045441 RepID=A0A2M9HEI8_9BIFI|nr:sensor histidine kinase [Bifidobacterium simiarum]PJM75226.1 sensor histidine kinase [Bifidobacterium simiarum]
MLGSIMFQIPPYPHASGSSSNQSEARAKPILSVRDGDGDIVLPARRLWSVVLIALGIVANLAHTSFAGALADDIGDAPGFLLAAIALFAGCALPFLLLHRDRNPMLVLTVNAIAAVLLPLGSLTALCSLSALVARDTDRRRLAVGTALASAALAASYVKDLLRPLGSSLWKMLFTEHDTGVGDVPARLLSPMRTIVIIAVVWGLGSVAASVLAGLYLRTRAIAQTADAKVHAERSRADTLASDLQIQRFADAVAAEAHDTLAHSLSLIAVNASAMQAQASHLASSLESSDTASDADHAEKARALAERASQIRRQAAGALDEAHSIIDMLRHPQEARIMLAPSDETALTREALYDVIDAARSAGMTLDTWIDVRDLSSLNPDIAKIAFRAVQEGLTNARRHAPEQRVSLEISASPANGVIILFSNATGFGTTAGPTQTVVDNADGDHGNHGGNGLPCLRERVERAGGTCEYGYDARNDFHLDVKLPFVSLR